jgi:hypothetical protein
MATKKQKRRRAKEQRHDYVWVDDEGNELTRGRSPDRRQVSTAPGSPGALVAKDVQAGAIFAPIMFGTVLLLSPGLAMATKITQTLLLLAIFIPFSYFIDGFFYRSAQRRAARNGGSDARRGS